MLEKARLTDRELIESLLIRQENAIKREFSEYLRNATSPAVIRQIKRLLSQSATMSVLDIADSHVARLGDSFPRLFQQVGYAESSALRNLLPKEFSGMAVSFDPSKDRPTMLVRQARSDFVNQFIRGQRDLTGSLMAEGLRQGLTPTATAELYRRSIGLTRPQWDAIASYRRALIDGDRDALSRTLRDRRFDSTVEHVIEGDRVLTNAEIKRMVERYRLKQLSLRSQTIAHTTALMLVNMARREAQAQMLEQTRISPNLLVRTWRSQHDGRTRESHLSLNGQRRPFNEPFVSSSGATLMFPGDPSAPTSEVVNCRCMLTVDLLKP